MKNITIYCKDFDLTDSIKSYLTDKITMLNKFLNTDEGEVSFNCRLGKTTNNHNSGKIFYVEVSVHTPPKNYGARIEADDIYVAIDLIKDELSANINNYKDKLRTLHKKESQKFKQDLHSIQDEL
jgi:ribosomal subunit interface protein